MKQIIAAAAAMLKPAGMALAIAATATAAAGAPWRAAVTSAGTASAPRAGRRAQQPHRQSEAPPGPAQ